MALTDYVRNLLVSTIGEFIGTFLFMFFPFAAAQTVNIPSATGALATGPDPTRLLYISFAFGFSLTVNVWLFFRVSGAAFNPAVTLALVVLGAAPIVTALCAIAAQLLASIAAAVIVKLIIPSPGNVVHFAVGLGDGASDIQGFFVEMFATFELVFTILMIGVEKTKSTFIAPLVIGLSLFLGHMIAIFWSGAGINPARAFGPAAVAGTFPSYEWIYWFGPFAGALLAAGFFKILKLLEYEKVNGNQDKSGEEEDLSPLLARQTDEIEKQLRAWGPRARRSSDPESLDYSPRSPHSSGGRSGSRRYREQPRGLRLYRLSGLEPYMSKEDLQHGKPVMREFEYTPTQSRYGRSNPPYSPQERPQHPREW